MDFSARNVSLSSTTAARERLSPSSLPLYTFIHHSNQYPSSAHSESSSPSPSSSSMNELGEASEAGPPSHETSASPPPAKRTRRGRAGKTPTSSAPGSPRQTRARARNVGPIHSNSSTSVERDTPQDSTPDLPGAIPDQETNISRASSEMPPPLATRSKKRKADQMESETPSINGERDSKKALLSHSTVVGHEARPLLDATVGTPEEGKTTDQDEATEPPVRRGRPPNSARGSMRGRGRGGRAKGLSRQHSGVPEGIKKPAGRGGRGGFGRGGRGKKISANFNVQVAYDRQAHLKRAYKEVSRVLQAALEALAEKSLEMTLADPNYHKKQPEYKQVINGLAAQNSKVVGKLGVKYNMQVDYEKKKREQDDDYVRREFHCKVVDMKDKYELRCKAAILDHLQKAKLAEDAHASVGPDDHFQYRVLSEEKRNTLTGEVIAEPPPESPTEPGRRGKRGSPKKRLVKDLLASEPTAKRPSLLTAATAPPEEPDDGEGSGETRPAPILEERTDALPRGSSPTPDAQVRMGEDDDYPTVMYPNYVKRGRAQSPNNRAVVRPSFQFEEGEIGFRSSEHEVEGRPLNPSRFYYDQTSFTSMGGGGYKLADHKLGDFDPKLVERFQLHAQSGLPVPGSCNPDNVAPPTDFSQPLTRTNPVIFVSTDGKKTIETSRSAFYVHTAQDWEKFEKLMDIKKRLGKYDIRDVFTQDGLATYDAVAREVAETQRAVEALLQAASTVEVPHAIEKPATLQKLSDGERYTHGPSLAMPDRAPRTFEEVKEIAREDFMRRMGPRQAPLGRLDELADMAERLSQETARRSPAPAQFVHQPSIQVGYIPPIYPPPNGRATFSVGYPQGSGRKAKNTTATSQVSPRTMTHSSNAPQPVGVQSMVPHQMPPMAPQSMAPPGTASQAKRSQKIGPPSGLPQSTASHTLTRPPNATQSAATSSNAPQQMAPQIMGPPKMAPQAPTPQAHAPHPMAPPPIAHSQMPPQPASPRIMAPPAVTKPKMTSPIVSSQKNTPHSMGPPPVLPQPTMSSFTRPRSMSGEGIQSQNMLPPPTPSQMPSPRIHSPQHLTQAQQYFQGARHQQQVQQQQLHHQQLQQQPSPLQQQPPLQQQQPMQQQPVQQQPVQQQPVQQQPLQQQPLQPSPTQRPSRSGPSSSGLRDLLPRPDRGSGSSRHVPRAHRRYYENAAPIPPYQGPVGPNPPDRGYSYPVSQVSPQPQQYQYVPQHQQPQPQPLQFQNTTQQQQGQLQAQQFQQHHPTQPPTAQQASPQDRPGQQPSSTQQPQTQSKQQLPPPQRRRDQGPYGYPDF